MAAPRRLSATAAVALAAVLLACCCTSALGAAHRGWAACDPSVMQSSGYIDIPGARNTQKHYFYWLFGPRRWPTDGSQPPVVLWMTGGPGCSSSSALLTELGPCMMNETSGETYHNAYGWNDEAYLLFVDQASGVGYSYADKINYDHNESEAAEDMYNFLQRFAKRFPSLSITGANDFYITGESYAGHYIPALGYRILQGNQRGDGPVINLKGIAVGNGLTDPYTQYPYYAEMAYNGCKKRLGKSCVTDDEYEEMLSLLPKCLETIAACNAYESDQNDACVQAGAVCLPYAYTFSNSGKNVYDIREECCYENNGTDAFMRDAAVMKSLGADPALTWNQCNDDVYDMFSRDYHRNFNYTIPPMLAAGIRVMIYAGDVDYICNWMGNKAWVQALEWPGKASFNAASDVEFSVAGRAAGEERVSGNFSFVRIYDAGHMVPMDQPEASLYMLSRFLNNKKLAA